MGITSSRRTVKGHTKKQIAAVTEQRGWEVVCIDLKKNIISRSKLLHSFWVKNEILLINKMRGENTKCYFYWTLSIYDYGIFSNAANWHQSKIYCFMCLFWHNVFCQNVDSQTPFLQIHVHWPGHRSCTLPNQDNPRINNLTLPT